MDTSPDPGTVQHTHKKPKKDKSIPHILKDLGQERFEINSHITGRHHWKTKVKVDKPYRVLANPKNKTSKVACKVIYGKNTLGFVPETTQRLAQLLSPLIRKKLIKVFATPTTTHENMIGYDKGQGLILPCKYLIYWLKNNNNELEKQIFKDNLKDLEDSYVL